MRSNRVTCVVVGVACTFITFFIMLIFSERITDYVGLYFSPADRVIDGLKDGTVRQGSGQPFKAWAEARSVQDSDGTLFTSFTYKYKNIVVILFLYRVNDRVDNFAAYVVEAASKDIEAQGYWYFCDTELMNRYIKLQSSGFNDPSGRFR